MFDATRPLGAGQVLDRAVTLYVRAWLPLFLIAGAVAVPFAILSSMNHDSARVLSDYSRLLVGGSNDPATRAALQQALARDQGAGASSFLLSAADGVFTPLWLTAAYIFATAFHDGRTVSAGAAYRAAIGRWGLQIVVTILGFAMIAVTGIALAIPITIAVVIFVFLKVPAAAVIVAIVAFFLLVVAMLLLQALTLQLAAYAVAVDGRSPVAALGSAIRATFDGQYRRTTLGVGAALVALLAFSLLLVVGGMAIAAALHLSQFALLITTPLSIAAAGVEVCVVTVFARELGNRRSGSDLVQLAEAPQLA